MQNNSLLGLCQRGGCEQAAAHLHPTSPPEITCSCGVAFCILCSEAPHFPTSCAHKRKWVDLLHQSPDAQYIMTQTRPCPKCGVRTQRSAGCMHIDCTQCGTEWCWACGQMGKGVHHTYACTRKPDPKWKFEAEERKVLDGTLAEHVEEFVYRGEQAQQIVEAPVAPASDSAAASAEAASPGASLGAPTRDSLRPTLLRAVRLLRWAQVWVYFAKAESLAPRVKLALRQATECTDWLLAACNFDGLPDAAALRSGEAALRVQWLVTCLLYLSTHVVATEGGE